MLVISYCNYLFYIVFLFVCFCIIIFICLHACSYRTFHKIVFIHIHTRRFVIVLAHSIKAGSDKPNKGYR